MKVKFHYIHWAKKYFTLLQVLFFLLLAEGCWSSGNTTKSSKSTSSTSASAEPDCDEKAEQKAKEELNKIEKGNFSLLGAGDEGCTLGEEKKSPEQQTAELERQIKKN